MVHQRSYCVCAATAISIMNFTVLANATTFLKSTNPSAVSLSSFGKSKTIANNRRFTTTAKQPSSLFSSSLSLNSLAFAHYNFNSNRKLKSTSLSFSSSPSVSSSKEENSDETITKFATTYHAPVMAKECISSLLKCNRGIGRQSSSSEEQEPLIFIDGTLGGGGHSLALLQQLKPNDIVIGCDVDPNALKEASTRLKDYIIDPSDEGKRVEERPMFIPVQSNFRDLVYTLLHGNGEEGGGLRHPITGEFIFESSLSKKKIGKDEKNSGTTGVPGVDGILLDFGVSSHQIDDPKRGFAFMKDGPLDMRMSRGSGDDNENFVGGLTAADICNEFDENELKNILRTYGDEPRSKQIARSIINHRPLSTTQDLMNAIADVTPEFARKGRRMGRTATAARVFQSLRIVVNEEDSALGDVLMDVCPTLVRPGGRLVVLSYHSMEDRATKRVMRDGTIEKRRGGVERDIYGNIMQDESCPRYWKPLGKNIKAAEEEVKVNSRARSATLRVAERLDV